MTLCSDKMLYPRINLREGFVHIVGSIQGDYIVWNNSIFNRPLIHPFDGDNNRSTFMQFTNFIDFAIGGRATSDNNSFLPCVNSFQGNDIWESMRKRFFDVIASIRDREFIHSLDHRNFSFLAEKVIGDIGCLPNWNIRFLPDRFIYLPERCNMLIAIQFLKTTALHDIRQRCSVKLVGMRVLEKKITIPGIEAWNPDIKRSERRKKSLNAPFGTLYI